MQTLDIHMGDYIHASAHGLEYLVREQTTGSRKATYYQVMRYVDNFSQWLRHLSVRKIKARKYIYFAEKTAIPQKNAANISGLQ
jgi:acyl-coenzyme A synthetase/AMP-(fatty) acid ligase